MFAALKVWANSEGAVGKCVGIWRAKVKGGGVLLSRAVAPAVTPSVATETFVASLLPPPLEASDRK